MNNRMKIYYVYVRQINNFSEYSKKNINNNNNLWNEMKLSKITTVAFFFLKFCFPVHHSNQHEQWTLNNGYNTYSKINNNITHTNILLKKKKQMIACSMMLIFSALKKSNQVKWKEKQNHAYVFVYSNLFLLYMKKINYYSRGN